MYTTYAQYGNARVKLTWVPSAELPPVDRVTSVHGICFLNGEVLLVDLKDRGFDIPGGHLELGETPEECFKRECREEGYVEVDHGSLLGHVIVDNSEDPNWRPGGKYPLVGYQVFYRMEVIAVLPFEAQYESARRVFVPPNDVPRFWHGWSHLGQYVLEAALAPR